MAHFALIMLLVLGGFGYIPKNDIALTITIYTINNRKLWTYSLDMRSLSVTRHYLTGEPDRLLHQRDLTLKEVKKIDRFLGRYPFGSLEKYYINEKIHGDTGTVYRIRINRGMKVHYVYYARPAQVMELNRFINRLLPRQYRLWDDEK